jgi:phosphate-selective porin
MASLEQCMVAQNLNLIIQEAEAGIFKFKVSLDYRTSSRTARAMQRNSVSKNQK